VVYDEGSIETPPAWPVGIIGQNQQFLSEPPDANFVKSLGRNTGRLHIYDPGRFRYVLGGSPIARFFERRPGGLAPFLAQLGCFVHRTDAWWQESAGRELYGAMAIGVPVLCPRDSIHAERIEHGVDGLLYGSSEEAEQQLSDLRREPALATAIGRAGRDKMRALLDGKTQSGRYRELILGTADTVTRSA
jgi:glycosyltransferase involved in cell wall biosynthesis